MRVIAQKKNTLRNSKRTSTTAMDPRHLKVKDAEQDISLTKSY